MHMDSKLESTHGTIVVVTWIAGKTPLRNNSTRSRSLKNRVRVIGNTSTVAQGIEDIQNDVGILLKGFDLVHIFFIPHGKEVVKRFQ